MQKTKHGLSLNILTDYFNRIQWQVQQPILTLVISHGGADRQFRLKFLLIPFQAFRLQIRFGLHFNGNDRAAVIHDKVDLRTAPVVRPIIGVQPLEGFSCCNTYCSVSAPLNSLKSSLPSKSVLWFRRTIQESKPTSTRNSLKDFKSS